MRLRLPVLLLILFLASPALPEDEPPRNPFTGWTSNKKKEHRRKARSKIARHLNKWLSARPAVVMQCERCGGRGKVMADKRKVACEACHGSGARINHLAFYRVFWDYYRPAVRKQERLKKALDRRLKKIESNPVKRLPELASVTGGKRGDITVLGNFATVTFSDVQGRKKVEQKVEWIEDEGEWWIAHEAADKGFVRWRYDEPELKRGAKTAEDRALDEKFEVTAPTVSPAEGNDLQVRGRVRNRTSDKPFASVGVRVTLYRGDEVVATAECQVEAFPLQPGESATYRGTVRSEKKLEYDRVEAKVSGYDELR